MEYTWDKKKTVKLLEADFQILEDFRTQYIPSIYTWIYYQVGADANMAAELTEKTLVTAIKNIGQFQPRQQSFYYWLKEIAKQTRDEGLIQRQLKPQRPQAWSDQPETILTPLSLLRQAEIPETVCNNTFVREMVRTTLAEMDFVDRELMIHRYAHLDTPANIADEMKLQQEEIENRLYRCRHSFKRIFTHLIATTNSGFSESNAPAGTEILDNNLEKLLSATEMNLVVPQDSLERIYKAVTEAVQSVSDSKSPGKSAFHYFIIAGAVGLVIAAVIAAALLLKAGTPPELTPSTPEDSQTNTIADKNVSVPDNSLQDNDSIDDEEIVRILEICSEGDIDALLEILKSGQKMSQVTAALFLAKLADPSAIEALSQAERQWYPDGPKDNPFAQAIDAIAARYPDEVDIIEEAPPVSEPQVKEITPSPDPETPQQQPTVSGIVHDYSNAPLGSVSLNLFKHLTSIHSEDSQELEQTQTSPDGSYLFTTDYQGHAYLRAVIANPGPPKTITKAIWCQKNATARIDFSGKPTLWGQITLDGNPLANQTIYLSDNEDLTLAAYGQKTQTDAEGSFEFWGISPGTYVIFKVGPDGLFYRLGQVQMPARDTYITNIRIEPVRVVLPGPSDPDAALPEIELMYAQNASEEMYQYKGTVTNDGQILFENVVGGSYLLRIKYNIGTWLQQTISVIDGIGEQVIEPESLFLPDVILSGRFLKNSPVDLFLTNTNRSVYVNIEPESDGYYEAVLPQDIYQLAAYIRGEFVELTLIDLQDETEFALDIDPDQILELLSPFYVVLADQTGSVLSGVQIVLSGENTVAAALSSGRGAFLAVQPGRYQLNAVLPGQKSIERDVQITQGNFQDQPDGNNTLFLQFSADGQ